MVAALAMLALSCKAPYTPSDQEVFSKMENVGVMVGYKEMIDFSTGNLQYSYNPSTHVYRGGVCVKQEDANTGNTVETVQYYFVLCLDREPGEADSELGGSMILCSNTIAAGTRSYDLKSAKVLKRNDSLIWIWDSALHLGVVIRK